eukprot:CAMPEP_0170134026 /NCGR_PEP_ID=MMETSP0033_2-20121228/1666_1 /TAXON_ID=195969 /ORGANISM="Dolichomastix tenuilepis, Strain CCMP3274" /LENGTH=408 /DNA_ID=CAMNT_0010369561 /DNA_START=144 /DNA_END=1367 /DNA_ORIENTATION=-
MPLFVVDAENLCVEIGRLFALVPPRRLEQRPQRFCRGHQRVVRQIAKEVVRCVAVRDVVREMIHAVPEPAVNRLERAEHVVPLPVLKRLRLVRVVLEVRDGEEPPRKDEVRGAVADEPVGQVEARERNGEAEEGCHAGGADGALSALQRRSVEEPRIWVEVRAVRSAPARLEEQVPGEAEERPPRMIEREKAHDWIHSLVFFGVEPRVRVVLRAVVVEAVVLLVRVRPRPVRHEEDGVADVADNVVQALRFAEARVPAVVTDDEAHPHHETRDAGVQRRQERVLATNGAHEKHSAAADRSAAANKSEYATFGTKSSAGMLDLSSFRDGSGGEAPSSVVDGSRSATAGVVDDDTALPTALVAGEEDARARGCSPAALHTLRALERPPAERADFNRKDNPLDKLFTALMA